MSCVRMLSLSAMGMPCSGPRMCPCARSRSRSSASSSACGFTVITQCSLSSYMPMRARYSVTSSREVTRFCSMAARICGMVASTMEGLNEAVWSGRAARRARIGRRSGSGNSNGRRRLHGHSQNTSRRANWICRELARSSCTPADVILPNVELVSVTLGLSKFGWLKVLKISDRNCR